MKIWSLENIMQHLPRRNEYCGQQGGGENSPDQVLETIARSVELLAHLRRPMLCEMWPTNAPPRKAPTFAIITTLEASCWDNPLKVVRKVG